MHRTPRVAPALLGAALIGAPAAAADVTIPKGTAIEVIVDTPFDSDSVAKGQAFSARVLRSVFVDGQLALPRDTPVKGEIKHVRNPKDGARSGAIAVKFEDLALGGRAVDIEGVLTSVMADQRRKIVEHQGKVTTGRHVDVVLIGSGTEATLRADTLVGLSGLDREDLADEWAKSGLGPARVFVGVGTQLAMQLDDPVTVPVRGKERPGPNDRNILTSETHVRALQEALRARKLYTGEATGTLDEATRSAIALYQLDRGARIATGDPDADTLEALGVKVAGR
jgi:hypothetical protein